MAAVRPFSGERETVSSFQHQRFAVHLQFKHTTQNHTSLFASMTAAENVTLAAQRLSGRPWWPLPRRRIPVDRLLADVGLAGQLAEIGVMLLMFGVGLHFSLNDLMAVKKIAVPGAMVQIAVATGLLFGLAPALQALKADLPTRSTYRRAPA